MSDTLDLRRIATLLVALVAITAIATGAVMAAEHTDELVGDDTDVIEEFNASDEQYIEHTIEPDEADFGEDGTETVYFNITYDDTEHLTYSEDVDDADADYLVNVSHEDLETVPGDAGDDVTVNANAWGEDADGEVTTALDEFEVTLEFHDEYAVIYIDEADDVEDEEAWYWFDSFTAESSNDVGVVDEDTVVHIHSADDDLNDAVELATEPTDDGDRVALMMATTLDGDIVYVFDAEPGETIAGDDVEDEDLSYIVVYDDDYATLYLGDDYEEHDDEVSVDVLANERPAMGDLRDTLDYGPLQALSGAWGLSIPLLSLAGLLVLSRRR